MTTPKIKCACNWLDCKARLEISEDNKLYLYHHGEDVAESFFLPRPIAKAILDVCKVMDENDVAH